MIARPKFDAILIASKTSRERSLAEIHALAEIITPAPLPEPVCRDPDDDEVLALALAASVDCIVSGDLDLLDLHQFQNIPILTAAQALQRLNAG